MAVPRTEAMFYAYTKIYIDLHTYIRKLVHANDAVKVQTVRVNGVNYYIESEFFCEHCGKAVTLMPEMTNGARARFEHRNRSHSANCKGGAVDEEGNRKAGASKVLA